MTQNTPVSVLITEPSGNGKTFLAKTLAAQACVKSPTVP
ncbi:ATP-binding protein [Sutterella massiliensis]|nr:ATP-binding protein [Sutterella massiliensis]